MNAVLADLAVALATYHGALTVGLTTYPALEAKFALTNERAPNVSVETILTAPISRPEPVGLKLGIHLTVWRF